MRNEEFHLLRLHFPWVCGCHDRRDSGTDRRYQLNQIPRVRVPLPNSRLCQFADFTHLYRLREAGIRFDEWVDSYADGSQCVTDVWDSLTAERQLEIVETLHNTSDVTTKTLVGLMKEIRA